MKFIIATLIGVLAIGATAHADAPTDVCSLYADGTFNGQTAVQFEYGFGEGETGLTARTITPCYVPPEVCLFDGSGTSDFEYGLGDENDLKGLTVKNFTPCYVPVDNPTLSLPRTGIEMGWLSAFAAAFMLAGAAILRLARR